MTAERKRPVRVIGTLLGGAVILALIVHYDPESVVRSVLDVAIHALLGVILLLIATVILNALAPMVLLGLPDEGELSWLTVTRAFLGVQPLTLFSPGRLSDFAAWAFLKRHHQPGSVASAIIMDRLLSLLFLLILTPAALRIVAPTKASATLDLAILAGLLLVGATPFLLTSAWVRHMANRTVLRCWPAALTGFGTHLRGLLSYSSGRLAINLGLTLAKAICYAGIISLLATDLGLPVSLLTALWMSVLLQLATAIPISIQGLGVAEGVLVLLFVLNGLPGAAALSITLISRLLLFLVLAVVYITITVPLAVTRK